MGGVLPNCGGGRRGFGALYLLPFPSPEAALQALGFSHGTKVPIACTSVPGCTVRLDFCTVSWDTGIPTYRAQATCLPPFLSVVFLSCSFFILCLCVLRNLALTSLALEAVRKASTLAPPLSIRAQMHPRPGNHCCQQLTAGTANRHF